MGRKDKLRREKQRKAKVENAAATATAPLTTTTVVADEDDDDDDQEFPKSDSYVLGMRLNDDHNKYNIDNDKEIKEAFMRGATEYGCVQSMGMVGLCHFWSNLNGKQIHLGVPWLLEEAIRGAMKPVQYLVEFVYNKVWPGQPRAIQKYWMKMFDKYYGWSESSGEKSNAKEVKDSINRVCFICFKRDTETLTLRQCKGCSTYCYCSQECQTIHHKDGHKAECRQVKILTKYHKPYAKEIRQAAIRGETHPALEKLRHKLGLSRPEEEYQELKMGIHEGKPINPYEYVVARNDGTVWVGSTPYSLGPSSDDTTTTIPTPIKNSITSAKDDQSNK
eukprot:CAMPEP_0171005352 /NCGR_PEP_ID=MMETSP0736-20130129/18304_1 /TAXON_ID=186038 /ORGANISM="Fragilariopsis kerguelensis, Strain L26-C5" /LENGTH=333 /DNA_ID=CAMNT_0011435017 /DNA_START=79 /DNA_END=1080 /DNA_ORIENTATION=-